MLDDEVKAGKVPDIIEKLEYKRRDGVVLTTKQDIAFCQKVQQEEIRENLMLGDYDSKGNYKIKEEIVKELLAVNKMIKENFDSSYVLVSRNKQGPKQNLKFTVTVTKNEETNKKTATLKLVEMTHKIDGSVKERIATVLAKYSDDDDIYFFKKVKQVFNLAEADEGEGKEIMDELLVAETIKRQQKLAELQKVSAVKMDALNTVYLERFTKLMLGLGDFGKHVLASYGEMVKNIDLKIPGNPARVLNELAQIIEEAKKKFKLDDASRDVLSRILDEYLTANTGLMIEFAGELLKKAEEARKKKEQEIINANNPVPAAGGGVKDPTPYKQTKTSSGPDPKAIKIKTYNRDIGDSNFDWKLLKKIVQREQQAAMKGGDAVPPAKVLDALTSASVQVEQQIKDSINFSLSLIDNALSVRGINSIRKAEDTNSFFMTNNTGRNARESIRELT